MPNQNAFVESFNPSQREKYLIQELLMDLLGAKKRFKKWRMYHNEGRPNSFLQLKTLIEFEDEQQI
jgi:hypothetical protein